MKANELRLGNLAILNVLNIKHCGRIHSMMHDHVFIGDGIKCNYGDLEPIVISEEWLLKCGFIRTSLYKNYKLSIRADLHIVVSLSEKRHAYVNVLNIEAIHVIYLHQLQNLYYALTGKELIIDSYTPAERQQMQDRLDKGLNQTT